jgi:hypothetical protein
MSNPYAGLLNPSTQFYVRPIRWASCFSVLIHFAQWNTLQNTWKLLLHTYFVRFFVALKSTSTPQCVAVCIFCGKLWNTHQYTAQHHTLFRISHSIQVWQFRRNEMANNCWNLCRTKSLFSLWQLAASGRRGQSKLPTFSIKFRARASRKFLCVSFRHHMMSGEGIYSQ